MKIDYSQFEHNNWDEFVHVRALMDLLKKVATVKFDDGTGADSFDEIQSIEFTKDADGMNSIAVVGTKNGQPGQIIKSQHNSPTELDLTDENNGVLDKLITWLQLNVNGGEYAINAQTVDGKKVNYNGTFTQIRAEIEKGKNQPIQSISLGFNDPNNLTLALATYLGEFKMVTIPLNVQPLTSNIQGENKTIDYINVDDINHRITLGNSTENDLMYITIPGMIVDYPDGH